MNFSYFIMPDLNLILEVYIGEFEFKEIFECKKLEMQDPDWRDSYDVLGDIRNGKISLTDHDVENLHKYFKNNPEINTNRKSAILTKVPSQVVFGTLLQRHYNIPESLVLPKVFSTVQAAIPWLGIDQKENESIEILLEQLSND